MKKGVSLTWIAIINALWSQQLCQARIMDCRPAYECQALQCDPRPKRFEREGKTQYPITCEGMMSSPASQNISKRINRLQEMVNQTRRDQNLELQKKISESEGKMKQTAIRDAKFELSKTKAELEENARQRVEYSRQNIMEEMDDEFGKVNITKIAHEKASIDLNVTKASSDLREEISDDMAELEERMRIFITSSIEEASAAYVPGEPSAPGTTAGEKLKCYDYVDINILLRGVRKVKECDEGWVCVRFEFIGSYGHHSTRTSKMLVGECLPSCDNSDCKHSAMSLAWYNADATQINLGEEIKSCAISCCSTHLCNG